MGTDSFYVVPIGYVGFVVSSSGTFVGLYFENQASLQHSYSIINVVKHLRK